MLQIILTLAIFLILVIPMGKYMYHIAAGQKTFADRVFDPIDHLIYKVCGIKGENMGWKKYALSLLLANAVMVFAGYVILRIQGILFLNPNGIEGMDASLSFNTIISFMTNTNLQHYSGEAGLSYASQMCVIIFMGGSGTFLRQSDVRYYFYDVYIGSQRLCCMYGILPGACRKETWKFLSGYGADYHTNFNSGIFSSGADTGKSGDASNSGRKLYDTYNRRKTSGFGNGTSCGTGSH